MRQEGNKTLDGNSTSATTVEKGNNLIVNYLPNALTDDEFFQIFDKIGPLNSAKIMRNKITGYSYGYGFVSYSSATDAEKAIRQLNGAQLQHKKLKVAYCRRAGEGPANDIKNANLFIANLPSNFTEDHLETTFRKYGEIVRSKILVDHSTGVSKGCGFVLFSKTCQADEALNLNGQTLDVPGFQFTHPLIVKKAKDENKTTYSSNATMLTRPLPVHVIHHYAPTKDRNGVLEGGVGVGRTIHKYPSNPADIHAASSPSVAGSGVGGESLGHTLYIYGIGSQANELDLYALFAPFGAIVKVHVMRDIATRAGKGFGFVTFGDYHDACLAVQTLNGYPFQKNSMRPLQVSFKTMKSSKTGGGGGGGGGGVKI